MYPHQPSPAELSSSGGISHNHSPQTIVVSPPSTLREVYRQVLGNSYIRKTKQITLLEAQFISGELSVKDFVRAMAKSDLYQLFFVSRCPRYRTIEHNFRHLLGRSPINFDEMQLHDRIIDTQGFAAEIDSYLDSEEYQAAFGDHTVPFMRNYPAKGSIARFIPAIPGLQCPWESPLEPPKKRGDRTQSYSQQKLYRIEATGFRNHNAQKVSSHRRSDQVFLVPHDRLSQELHRIHLRGGIIMRVTAL